MFSRLATSLTVLMVVAAPAAAETDTFGVAPNQFEIEFVRVGNPGNFPDTSGNPSSVGAVDYVYEISKFEISRDMIRIANLNADLGITLDPADLEPNGGYRPEMPASTGLSWNEAARFTNWLNADQAHSHAYLFHTQPGQVLYDANANNDTWIEADEGFNPSNPMRNSNARYVLPSEDEWYKAAYYDPHANDGQGGYWEFTNGSNEPPLPVASGIDPGTAVYGQPYEQGPADITEAGGPSPYGVVGMGGNVFEWEETAVDLPNVLGGTTRGVRGGTWIGRSIGISRSWRLDAFPSQQGIDFLGFRVVRIVDPSTFALGDFDGDDVISANDMNLLSEQVLLISSNDLFDLDDNGTVNQQDRIFWVEQLAGTHFGDADLNGTVEFADFLQLSTNFNQPTGWAGGDFDGNGTAEFADFLLLSDNFGKIRSATALVPEPNAQLLAIMVSCLLLAFQRRRST